MLLTKRPLDLAHGRFFLLLFTAIFTAWARPLTSLFRHRYFSSPLFSSPATRSQLQITHRLCLWGVFQRHVVWNYFQLLVAFAGKNFGQIYLNFSVLLALYTVVVKYNFLMAWRYHFHCVAHTPPTPILFITIVNKNYQVVAVIWKTY